MDKSKDLPMGIGQLELFSIVLSMLCSSLIHHWFTTRYSYFYFIGGSVALFIVEFLSMCLPPLLIHTYFGNYVVLATVFMLSICFLLCNSTRELRALRTSIFREFKVKILVSTCVVIAAVDCKRIFTPEFSKTQTYGFSPMDLGTGMFVAMRALDSLRRDLRQTGAFRVARSSKPRQEFISFESTSPERQTKKPSSFQYPRFLPLLLIGLARVAFVEFSGYYQDPAEYGTHWNFFITLALIEVFISLFQFVFRNELAVPIVSFLVGLAYFAVLLTTDFEKCLLGLETERTGLLDGNREGICSTFGYLFIFGLTYLVARFFMPSVIWNDMYVQHAEHPNLSFELSRNFVVQALIYMVALHQFGLPSRRIANLTYCLQIHTIVTGIILFDHFYMHIIGKRSPTASLTFQLPTLHSAISRHGFYFFIAANLLTGLLNYTRGYIQSSGLEFASMIIYMFTLCLSTKLVDAYFSSDAERRTFAKSKD